MFGIDFNKRVVLQFSGGKDSLVCLYLLRPYWDKITVMWSSTGDNFRETIEQMAFVKSIVPNFIEVTGDAPSVWREYGRPVDVIDCDQLAESNFALPKTDRVIKTIPYYECCARSFLIKMHEASQGFDYIVRGQRMQEHHKSPVKSGDVINGQTFIFPIETWTDREVLDYISRHDIPMTAQYKENKDAKSFDCIHCTAYSVESKAKYEYMDKHYHESYVLVKDIKKHIKNELLNKLNSME